MKFFPKEPDQTLIDTLASKMIMRDIGPHEIYRIIYGALPEVEQEPVAYVVNKITGYPVKNRPSECYLIQPGVDIDDIRCDDHFLGEFWGGNELLYLNPAPPREINKNPVAWAWYRQSGGYTLHQYAPDTAYVPDGDKCVPLFTHPAPYLQKQGVSDE